MRQLNSEQQSAVNCIEGQLLVVACPGSGKTTVIIERVKHMLDSGINPESILVITFTKEAALQMSERYKKEYGSTKVFFGTIHSICFRVIAKAYGIQISNLLKEGEQWDFFRNYLYKRVKTDDMENYIKNLFAELSLIKNADISLSSYTPKNVEKQILRDSINAYEEFKKENRKIDFDDMLIWCRKAFQNKPDELAFWQNKFRYIMIDEYQDTNKVQAEIFYMLAGEKGNLCVVGDDDQSIYRFRAADPDIMLGFPQKYPQCNVVSLDVNYRSEQEIIHRATALIKNNQNRFQKNFKGFKNEKGTVQAIPCDSPETQDMAVLKKISDLNKRGVPYNEMAILYRTNTENQLLIGKLLNLKVPFYTTETPRDYHLDFVFQDIMAYWRISQGTDKKGDFLRILNRPTRYLKRELFKNCTFNKKELLKVCENSSQSSSAKQKIIEMFVDIDNLSKIEDPTKFINYMVNIMDYDAAIDAYCEFCRRDKSEARDLLKTLTAEARSFTTMKEWNDYAEYYAEALRKLKKEKRKEGVCLSTFHSSKGLEWEYVFIINANEDNCPFKKAESDADYAEERRLFYVALTRAKRSCSMFYSKKGMSEDRHSRYLEEMSLL